MIESVQQALKDQGFYYGEITGETNANLSAAIRRYQIRNGLEVNGELNSETLRSLRIDSSASAQSAVKVSPSPAPVPLAPERNRPAKQLVLFPRQCSLSPTRRKIDNSIHQILWSLALHQDSSLLELHTKCAARCATQSRALRTNSAGAPWSLSR